MKAWKHIETGALQDIQTNPGPLPIDLDPDEWVLRDVTLEEIQAQYPPQREDMLQKLHTDLQTYLDERGYPSNTQLALLSLYNCCDKTQAKTRIKEALDFINLVMFWYDDQKEALETAQTPQDITWDMHELDQDDPTVTLRELKKLR